MTKMPNRHNLNSFGPISFGPIKLPNKLPNIVLPHIIPTGSDVFYVRNLIEDAIYALPEYKCEIGGYRFPRWIGSPPSEVINKVKEQVIRTLAYEEWEKNGLEGQDVKNWLMAKERFKDALFCWF